MGQRRLTSHLTGCGAQRKLIALSRESPMQRRDRSCARFFGVAVVGACAAFGVAPSMTAQGTPVTSCDEVLPAPREAGGQRVGPASCRSRETTLTFEGRALVRLDV